MLFRSEANLHRDPERIAKVISLVETIYSSYKEIIEGEQSKKLNVPKVDDKGNVVDQGPRVQISL